MLRCEKTLNRLEDARGIHFVETLARRDVAMPRDAKSELVAASGTEQADAWNTEQIGGVEHARVHTQKRIRTRHETERDG